MDQITKLYVSFMSYLQAFKKDEKGQGLVEYALILVLIAIVVMAALKLVGTQTSTTFSTVDSALQNK